MEKIEPCPFCRVESMSIRHTNIARRDRTPKIVYQVGCCLCHEKTPWFDTAEEAISYWNEAVRRLEG